MFTTEFYSKKYISLLLVLLSVLGFSQKKFTVVLDAGHGGSDNGAYRSYSDLGRVQEKDITLAIVLKLGKLLEKNKDFKVIYTRKIDEYPSLTARTDLANRNKADFFVSIHVNSSGGNNITAQGTETFVQGPNQNKANLEVAKAENEVIFLDENDKQNFANYDPRSPESLIALKIQQSKYLEASQWLGGLIEENFVKDDKRFSRGVKQADLHVLRRNAMPSVLVETGFVNNYEDAAYLTSEKGQQEVADSVYKALLDYRKAIGGGPVKEPEPVKPAEVPLKNDFRILLMSTASRYNDGDPALKGLNYILPIKENNVYKYYYAVTNLASVRDNNLKTAKDAGFRNAMAISFLPNQTLGFGYYTLEVAVTEDKLKNDSYLLKTLKDVERNKEKGVFYYTYGKYKTLEEAVTAQKEIETKGIKNSIIQKVLKN
ncbi:N-acetylmuramoyl-L-alanine amidase [Soonwooa sp.]|uniref:N-acetylmuramoyl-L-alanine amidase family protein n=1 Tax=Soonwooa sp. TaxID=1938592 RepID=UPI00262E7E2F|nr:N-acetylmuramoyl-L-alanine amidase [Soonwooa sp.]